MTHHNQPDDNKVPWLNTLLILSVQEKNKDIVLTQFYKHLLLNGQKIIVEKNYRYGGKRKTWAFLNAFTQSNIS